MPRASGLQSQSENGYDETSSVRHALEHIRDLALLLISVLAIILASVAYAQLAPSTPAISPFVQVSATTYIPKEGYHLASNTPVKIFKNYTIEEDAQNRVRLLNSITGELIALLGINGGIYGSDESQYIPGRMTVVPKTLNPPITIRDTWIATTALYIGSGTLILNTVCHNQVPGLCGNLYRNGEADPGIFHAPSKILFGDVPTGLILASSGTYMIVGGNVTLKTMHNLGYAMPCRPIDEFMTPSEPLELFNGQLYLSYMPRPGDSCAIYRTKVTNPIPTDTCTITATIPALQAIIATTPSQYIAHTATLNLQTATVTISRYKTPACSDNTPQTGTYTLGCSTLDTNNNNNNVQKYTFTYTY